MENLVQFPKNDFKVFMNVALDLCFVQKNCSLHEEVLLSRLSSLGFKENY